MQINLLHWQSAYTERNLIYCVFLCLCNICKPVTERKDDMKYNRSTYRDIVAWRKYATINRFSNSELPEVSKLYRAYQKKVQSVLLMLKFM